MNGKFFENKSGGYRAGLYFTFFITSFVVVSYLFGTISGVLFGKGSAGYTAVTSLSSLAAFFAVFFVAKFVFNEKNESFFGTTYFSRTFTGLSVILTFGMLFGLGFINDAFVKLLDLIGVSVNGISVEMNSGWEFIVCILSLCVIPAVAEELFFRGILLSSLKNAGFIVSALISALFFALYHLSLAQFFYQFVFGFFLAATTLRAGSVIPAIISHFLNNFAVLSFTYFNVAVDFYYLPLIFMGLIFLAAFSFILFIFKVGKNEKVKGEAVSAFIPFGLLGVTVCVALTVAGAFL